MNIMKEPKFSNFLKDKFNIGAAGYLTVAAGAVVFGYIGLIFSIPLWYVAGVLGGGAGYAATKSALEYKSEKKQYENYKNSETYKSEKPTKEMKEMLEDKKNKKKNRPQNSNNNKQKTKDNTQEPKL